MRICWAWECASAPTCRFGQAAAAAAAAGDRRCDASPAAVVASRRRRPTLPPLFPLPPAPHPSSSLILPLPPYRPTLPPPLLLASSLPHSTPLRSGPVQHHQSEAGQRGLSRLGMDPGLHRSAPPRVSARAASPSCSLAPAAARCAPSPAPECCCSCRCLIMRQRPPPAPLCHPPPCSFAFKFILQRAIRNAAFIATACEAVWHAWPAAACSRMHGRLRCRGSRGMPPRLPTSCCCRHLVGPPAHPAQREGPGVSCAAPLPLLPAGVMF